MRHNCGTKGSTMNGEPDPFEVLREANPVDPKTLPRHTSPAAQAQLEQIVAQPRAEPVPIGHRRWLRRRFRRQRRLPYLIPIVAVVAIGAGAAAWALTRGASNPLTIGCYATASLSAHTAVIPADGRSPTDACRAQWRQAGLGPAPPASLQACILPSGAIGVFPDSGGDVCQQLALTPLTSRQPPSATAVVELKGKLVDAFLANPCLSKPEAEAIIRTQLERLRLSAWTIRPAGSFDNARPCATLGFDTDANAVLLIPAPPP